MIKKQRTYILLGIISGVFLLSLGLSCLKISDSSLLERIDAPIQDRIFRLRNSLITKQPISQDVSLVAIDDYCYQKLGRFGTGRWLTREPFVIQLQYLKNVYKPSVLAYDITFSEVAGEIDRGSEVFSAEKLRPIIEVFSAEKLRPIIREIQGILQGHVSEIPTDILNDIAQLTNFYGDTNLATAFAELMGQSTDKTKMILAYITLIPKEKTVIQRGWSDEEIIGDDPDDLSEENGTLLPYLREISIPLDYIRNLPETYSFSPYAILPTKDLLDYSVLGYINAPRDEGGIVRRIPLIQGMEYKYTHPVTGKTVRRRFFLPSFSLLSVLSHWGVNLLEMNNKGKFNIEGNPIIEVLWGDAIVIRKPNGDIVKIPLDNEGNFYLDFVGSVQDFNGVSFADIGPYRASKKAKDILSNRIVITGLTATGATDVGPTPIHDNTPFVLVHMVAISNILTNTFILPLTTSGTIGILVAIWIILALFSLYLHPSQFAYGSMICVSLYVAIILYGIFSHTYVLPVAGPLFLLGGSYFVVVLYYYFSEVIERKKIRGMFATMVSEKVLEFLEDNPESFSLEGKKADATMLFSDVAGFTSISEDLNPERLVDLLNQYLSPMTEIILESKGYVDKYEGDLIMAEWGVPYPNDQHAKLACWAALDQQKKLAELRPIFLDEFGVQIIVRMGLNSGTVSAGNMGSEKRMSYTVMGDVVNQAARFEPANKDYGTSIMIGEKTYDLAQDVIEARLLDKIIVKGKTIPIKIYELIAKKGDLSQEQKEVLSLYHDGLHFHWEKKWDKALKSFRKGQSILPSDGPSLAMIRRVEMYQITPPPANWQGEFVRTSKD